MFRTVHFIPLILVVALLSCSSPEDYKKDADQEVAEILENKQLAAFDEAQEISIEKDPSSLEIQEKVSPPASDKETSEEETVILKAWDGPTITLNLRDALYLATLNSRSYQTRKEDVYLSALSLSLERHRWDFIAAAEIDGAYVRRDHEYSTEGGTGFSLSKALATGGSIGLTIGTDFLRYVSGDPRQSFISSVSATFSQPLLRGAGRSVAQEALTQAERNTVYELRDFRRFRQTFSVSVATSYYRVLQQKDRLRNEQENYNSLLRATERTRDLADAGRLAEFEVDQAMQDQLRASDRLAREIESYNQALDNFKITLSLRTDANIELDENDLIALVEKPLEDVPFSEEDAARLAFDKRMDFLNSLDQLDDSRRKVAVAEDGFLPELNLVGGANFSSEGPNNLFNVRPRDGTANLGLEFDPDFDRKEERNTYRQALITVERTRRQLQEDADQIRLEIRDSLRTLEQARESFEIQKLSVALAERRVESTEMLIKAGDATTRDLLDSQADLLDARNALTGAVIDFNVARQNLLSDVGILEVDDLGMWKWPSEAELKELIDRVDESEEEQEDDQ